MGAPSITTSKRGFTIVELLIVIVVIAILAAIVIVAYNGIRQRTLEASLKLDLQTATKVLENDLLNSGVYPASATSAQGGKGLQSSGSNTLTYTLKPYGYCVSGTNSGLSDEYAVRSSTKQIEDGNCDSRVTTITGVYGSGSAYVDGDSSTARLSCTYGVAVGPSGNLYVGTDASPGHIRKITPNGDVSTLATLASTAPYCPVAQVADSQGNVYFTVSVSAYAHRVWKVTPAGVISSFAGSSTASFADGLGSAARFDYPYKLAIDKGDNIYVADYGNNRIRMITPAGYVSTIAGNGGDSHVDGPVASAEFEGPNGIALDVSGNIYVGDGPRLRKISGGSVSTVAGNGNWGYNDGPVGDAEFQEIAFVVVDRNGIIYTADYDGAYIRKIIEGGSVSTVIGSTFYGSVDGSGGDARFRPIGGMALDPSGMLWVAGGNTLRKVEL